MITKSLPTFKHTSIGAKTHKAGTATAHLSYIMRSDAMTKFQAGNMPEGERGTRVFFDRLWEKAGMAENARIADKLMIALPVELNQEQRYELVQSFMHQLGNGRIAWCAAHHDSGEDAHNPHVHIVFKDADIATGRKVIGTTTNSRDVREAKEHGWKIPPRTTTADMRAMWCGHLNEFMERAGIGIRYDPRTLKEQGIGRDPEIHIGPKAQTLNEKGHAFESQDHVRGQRSIPYTMFDRDSRAGHNAHIKEANKQKEQENARGQAPQNARPHTAAREDQEKRTLREAQRQGRRAMYEGQQGDRDALRQAHEAQKLEHMKWARQLYAAARQRAFDAIKEQYADKWQAIRGMKNGKERKEAAAALKLEQKQNYAGEAAKQVNLRRPEKDAAWKAMLAQQEKERLDLRTQHSKETTALARQHFAERFGMHEKWRALSLDRQAGRIDARLTMNQGMAAQQRAAVETIKLHVRTGRNSMQAAGPPISANPSEAARAKFDIARKEQAKQEALRAKLSEDRRKNLERAGLAQELARGQSGRVRAESRATANGAASGKSSPHAIIAPGIARSRDRRSKWIQLRLFDADPQQQIRQAAASGRTLSSEERANASPEVRERLAREDRKSQQRSFFMGGNARQQDRDKGGRTGGGRGR